MIRMLRYSGSMDTIVNTNNAPPKLGLNRIESAEAISQSPATVDRVTKPGLLCSSRAALRAAYAIKETKRIVKVTTAQRDWAV
jgi:hypothetical protein